jgi:hypothetical protein
MKRTLLLYVLILAVSIPLHCFSQYKDAKPSVKSLKKLLKAVAKTTEPSKKTEWVCCSKSEDKYFAADTIKLYNPLYYYLCSGGCYSNRWIFSGSATISIRQSNVCEEPVRSSTKPENSDLNLKFKNKAGVLTIALYKGKELRDMFAVISIEHLNLKDSDTAYCITLVRRKSQDTK